MRYARATDDFYVPEPDDVRSQVGKPGAYSFEPVDAELAETTREELRAVYDTAYATYERLVELGVARELARAALPVGAYTEFFWTVNARALMNFVSLRNAETAQREIRHYAEAVERFLAEKMPVTTPPSSRTTASPRNAPTNGPNRRQNPRYEALGGCRSGGGRRARAPVACLGRGPRVPLRLPVRAQRGARVASDRDGPCARARRQEAGRGDAHRDGPKRRGGGAASRFARRPHSERVVRRTARPLEPANQVGPVLTANMAIRATGAAQPLAQYQQCTGAFAQVPVSLTGTFVLRTGTAFFSTIRRVRLRGLVVFNRAGPVACGPQVATACTAATWLSATTPDISASL